MLLKTDVKIFFVEKRYFLLLCYYLVVPLQAVTNNLISKEK